MTAPRARSDHFDGGRFFNPTGANGQPVWRVPRLLMAKRTKWPAHVPVKPRRPPAPRAPGEIVVTFVGHATWLLGTTAGNVLIDPVWVERASPVQFAGPRRVRAPGVQLEDLPDISLVLLSHNHYDHCDLRTLRALDRRYGAPVVTLLGNADLLRSAGVRRVEELDWWGVAATSPVPVQVTPAQHFSARTPFDRNRALWGGFVITLGQRRFYFAGDSGYAGHFGEIARRCGPIDLALLPIGAYEPRWFMRDIHMNPAEAVQAHLDLGAAQSLAMHFGTFQLTPEGIDAPVVALGDALRERGVPNDRFRVLDVGESWFLEASA